MKQKGFTLIELLAVIVILAIIALIAVPIILNVIDTAKKGSKESSVLGYVDAVEKQVMMSEVDSSANKIPAGTYTVEQLTELGINVKGEKPAGTSVVIIDERGRVTEMWATFEDSDYKIYYNGKYAVADKEDYIDKEGNKHNEVGTPNVVTPIVDSGPTKVEAQSGETHKGIVYLDPTNLSKTCTEVEANANLNNNGTSTETKTGCMKWYIYNDSGDNYTMLLDHNTTVRIKWNDSNSNVAYESSNLKPVVDDLVTTSGWKVTPRIISTEEITTIVGGPSSWNKNNEANHFYFEGTGTNKQTRPTYNDSKRSKYDWLYNNLVHCKTDNNGDYGCTVEDNDDTYDGYGTAGVGNNFCYWTSTTIGTAGSGTYMWSAYSTSMISSTNSKFASCGIRPVITIPKSTFD